MSIKLQNDIDELTRRFETAQKLSQEAIEQLDERLRKVEDRKKPGPKPKDHTSHIQP